jgi:hypothetical protein
VSGGRAGARRLVDVDGRATWTTPQELPGLSGFARHFTVLRETVSGGTTVATGSHAFQSVNYPARYIHRSAALGYLDAVSSSSTTAVKQEASFTVVPGLADSGGYSFVATDGTYLRHYAFRLRFDTNDGSAGFAKDATFLARPGSATGSVSLESYNYPGRYLRHRDFQLWADLFVDSDTYRADSSFTVASPWA